jgi:dihydrodipicolinate synthase/N-acetylneuraminate lyase
LVGALRAGGHGGVNGGAQIDPGLLVQLYEATVADDDARVGVLQDRLLRLGRIYSIGKHASTVIKGIKCALSLMGFCRDDMALPFAAFNPRERDQVRQVLEELGLLGAGSIISAANSSRR